MDIHFKWFLEISYDGTEFGGWQIQQNNVTIQGILENRLSKIYANQLIHIEACSRTDAGVHAIGQIISFMPPERPLVDKDKLYRSLNRMLPPSIRIKEVKKAPSEFHARFSTVGKAYTYVINNGIPNPFTERWSWHLPNFKEICEIRKAVSYLEGMHDFSSFTVERKEIENAERRIYRIDVQEFGEFVCITFVGNGFLYKMIRSIIGTLAFVGSGKISAIKIKKILETKNRCDAYDTAPSKGLFLVKVFYDEGSLNKFILEKPPFLN